MIIDLFFDEDLYWRGDKYHLEKMTTNKLISFYLNLYSEKIPKSSPKSTRYSYEQAG